MLYSRAFGSCQFGQVYNPARSSVAPLLSPSQWCSKIYDRATQILGVRIVRRFISSDHFDIFSKGMLPRIMYPHTPGSLYKLGAVTHLCQGRIRLKCFLLTRAVQLGAQFFFPFEAQEHSGNYQTLRRDMIYDASIRWKTNVPSYALQPQCEIQVRYRCDRASF